MVVRSCWKSRHKNSRGAVCRCGCGWVLGLVLVGHLWGPGALGLPSTVVQKQAEFDVIYSDAVTSENQTIYAFNHTVSRNKVSFRG